MANSLIPNGFYNFAGLPPANSVTPGTSLVTLDQGVQVSDGTQWLPDTGTSSPTIIGNYNIRNYGAVGDGSARALSTKYASLAAAQADFPSAAALTEELDYNAVRRAVEVATAAGGGVVYIPKGTYIMNNASSQGNIQLPVSVLTTGTPSSQVNIKGDGAISTVLKWPTDYGTTGSLFAISCGPQASSFTTPLTDGRYGSNYFYGFLEDFAMLGPNTSITRGTVNANLSGLAWGARRFLKRLHIWGFYAGLDIVGDWTSFRDCVVENCFYPLYFPRKSASLYGDLQFSKCSFGNAARATICIGTRGYMGAIFEGCFIGSGPYALLNEAATQGTTADSSTHVTSTVWTKCLFEGIGNSLIGDDNSNVSAGGAGTRNFRLERMCFDECSLSYNVGYKDTTQSRDANYGIVCTSLKALCMRNFNGLLPADTGLAQVDSISGWEWYGDLTALFSSLQSGKLLLDAAIGVGGPTTIRWKNSATTDRGTVWRGNAATIIQYDLVEMAVGGRAVQSTNSTQPVLGTAVHAQGTASAYVMVCHGGHRPIVNAVETPPSANQWIKKSSTGGRAIAATGPTDGQALGYVTSVNTGPTPNQYNFVWAGAAVLGD